MQPQHRSQSVAAQKDTISTQPPEFAISVLSNVPAAATLHHVSNVFLGTGYRTECAAPIL